MASYHLRGGPIRRLQQVTKPGLGSRPPGRSTVRAYATSSSTSDKIQSTLADLDAILGIEEKKDEEEEQQAQQQQQPTNEASKVSVSPEAVAALAEAEAKRAAANGTMPNRALQRELDRLAEQARQLSKDKDGREETAGEQALRKEFQQLQELLLSGGINHEDVRTIKEEVFKRTAFWVIEAKAMPGLLPGGILVRGNLKGQPEAVFQEVVDGTKAALGDKYIVRLVPDAEAQEALGGEAPAPNGPPRIAFEFLPAATSVPGEMAGWQKVVAGVLLVLTLASTLQLGLGANVGLLPKETLLWLNSPAAFTDNPNVLPPGLENYDPLPFLQSSLDVAAAALLPQLVHELGHSVVAAIKKIKIAPSYLVPNGQLGTFGSITQLKSFVKNRSDLWDFSMAGLGAGALVSLALFVGGIALSHGGNTAEPGLVPVPSQLFQGSLFLGGLARLSFGADTISHASIYVHPMLIGGWCGMVATAFNALPCGNLDGGRSMLASFGRNGLAVSSFLTYLGLGFSLLGSSLAWPFGIYLLLCQRESEKFIQDEVTGVSERRQAVSAALIVFAILVLLPMAPEVADVTGVGTPSNFL